MIRCSEHVIVVSSSPPSKLYSPVFLHPTAGWFFADVGGIPLFAERAMSPYFFGIVNPYAFLHSAYCAGHALEAKCVSRKKIKRKKKRIIDFLPNISKMIRGGLKVGRSTLFLPLTKHKKNANLGLRKDGQIWLA